MKWHSISQVAGIVNLSRQAVYKKLKRLSLEEKIKLGGDLIEDGQILLSDNGIKSLFEVTTPDNQVDTQVVEKCEKVDNPVNHEVVIGLQSQLVAKEREVVRMGDILDKVLGQLEEERRLRGEERQRTDTILMKLTNDISTLQKVIEYKKPEIATENMEAIAISHPPKEKKSPRPVAPATPRIYKNIPVQREVSTWESLMNSFDDVWGFAFGGG